jgi:hypothetical protein
LFAWINADDEDRRLQVHASRAFVRLARLETLLGEVRWPELLLRRRKEDIEENQLAQLWYAALCIPSTAASAWQALTGWLICGEDQPDVAESLLGLFRALARQPGLRSRLAHQRDHVWQERRPASPLLRAVAAIIEKD